MSAPNGNMTRSDCRLTLPRTAVRQMQQCTARGSTHSLLAGAARQAFPVLVGGQYPKDHQLYPATAGFVSVTCMRLIRIVGHRFVT